MAAHPADFAVLDNFNRANTGPPAGPGWANIGHWSDPVGYVTLGNQLAQSEGSWRADRWATSYSRATAAVALGMTIAVVGTGTIYWFLFDDPGAMSGYALRLEPPATWSLMRFSGSGTTLTSYSQAPAAGDGACLIADNDGNLTAWHRTGGIWTLKATQPDTTYTGNLTPAMSSANTAARWDDMFGGHPVPTGQTITGVHTASRYATRLGALTRTTPQTITGVHTPSRYSTRLGSITNAAPPSAQSITGTHTPSSYASRLGAVANDTGPTTQTITGTHTASRYASRLGRVARAATTRPRVTVPRGGRQVEETIILRSEAGDWMAIGSDQRRGLWHEGLSCAADRSGPSTCSFVLHRDPTVPWPDLAPFNVGEVWIAGELVWGGRMREAPGQSGARSSITFAGSGWQSHLDDDLVSLGWVHTRMADWVDATSFPGMSEVVTGRGTVSLGGGELLIGAGQGVTLQSNSTFARVTLDLGPHHPGAMAAWIEFSMDPVDALTEAYLQGHDARETTAGASTVGAISAWNMTSGVRYTRGGTFDRPRRCVSWGIYRPALGDHATTRPHIYRIHRVAVATDASYLSSGVSTLTASQVVRSVAQAGATPGLNPDTSGIEPTTFAIPHYWPEGHSSPRELMAPVNAFHDYDLGVDAHRRIFFRAPPTVASLEVGAWSGVEFADASAGSGEDIYTRAIVQAQDSLGQSVTVIRTAATAAPDLARIVPVDGFPAGDFELGSTGWTLSNMIRSNAYGAYGGAWAITNNAQPAAASATATGLVPGWVYILRYHWLRRLAAGSGPIGASTVVIDGRVYNPGTNSAFDVWDPVAIPFVASGPTATIEIRTQHHTTGGYLIDGIRVEFPEVNSVDRHRFSRASRLPISAPLTVAAAEALGDVWLRNHITTPFKGSLTVVGSSGVREAVSGAPVHPAHLLLRHGALIRHTGMADPDTGAWGRNGRIASVSYSGGTANVELDNERGRLDALISRYAALAGGVA